MNEIEELNKFLEKPVVTNARNSMGCSENWYNPYFAISKTFSLEEIRSMSEKEIIDLVKLASAISDGLY